MFEELTHQLVEWMSLLGPVGIYLVFTIIAYLENVVPPLPGDVLLAFGGYLSAEGLIGLFPLWALTVLASVMGFMNMYWIGHKLGNQISANQHGHFLLRFVNYKYIERGKKWMAKYGQWVVVGNRFLAGTRSVISLTAGMSNLNIPRTVANALLSSMLWNGVLLAAGWFIRDNWEVIGDYLSNYGKAILLGLALVVLVRFLWVRKTAAAEAKKKSES